MLFPSLVDSQQLVDDIRRIAIDENIHFIENEQKMTLVRVEVTANRLDDFARTESSFGVSGIEAEGNLLQDLGTGRVIAAVHVSDDDSSPTVEMALDVICETLGEDGFARADWAHDYSSTTRVVILNLREYRRHVVEFIVTADQNRRDPVVRQGPFVKQDFACSDAVEVSSHSTESCSHRS